jgi:hypothetical protein
LELGANFNEHLHVAKLPELDATRVRWIRGFLPAGEFLDGRRTLQSDAGIATLRAATATGRKLAITLKWDFKRSKWRVPAPESVEEYKAFAWGVAVVREMKPDLLLLVNETFIDTEEADLAPGADGTIPMVRFLQRLAAHIDAAALKAPSGASLSVSCGGFTRLDRAEMRNHPATRALLPWLASTPHLTHVNFHLHHADLAQFESAVKFMHAQVPSRPLVVTEFSLVWAYRAHMPDRLGIDAAGRAFAAKYKRAPDQTVADYLSAAARTPVTEEELHAFLAGRSWFDPQSLEKCCRLMEQNGVTLATYAYLQASSGLERAKSRVGDTQPPWRLNPIFQERHAYVPGGKRAAVNLGFFETFVRRQSHSP